MFETAFSDKYSIYLTYEDPSALETWGWKLSEERRENVVRFVRGAKCRDVPALYDEVAAAVQFPYYFGENWPAFEDCITDLEWLNCRAFFMVIFDADQLLADEEMEEFAILARIFQNARENRTIAMQNVSETPEDIPFYVILQCKPAKASGLTERLQKIGAVFFETGPSSG